MYQDFRRPRIANHDLKELESFPFQIYSVNFWTYKQYSKLVVPSEHLTSLANFSNLESNKSEEVID